MPSPVCSNLSNYYAAEKNYKIGSIAYKTARVLTALSCLYVTARLIQGIYGKLTHGNRITQKLGIKTVLLVPGSIAGAYLSYRYDRYSVQRYIEALKNAKQCNITDGSCSHNLRIDTRFIHSLLKDKSNLEKLAIFEQLGPMCSQLEGMNELLLSLSESQDKQILLAVAKAIKAIGKKSIDKKGGDIFQNLSESKDEQVLLATAEAIDAAGWGDIANSSEGHIDSRLGILRKLCNSNQSFILEFAAKSIKSGLTEDTYGHYATSLCGFMECSKYMHKVLEILSSTDLKQGYVKLFLLIMFKWRPNLLKNKPIRESDIIKNLWKEHDPKNTVRKIELHLKENVEDLIKNEGLEFNGINVEYK